MYKLNKSGISGEVTCINFFNGNIMLSIPINPDNTDYQAYLAWVSEGNTPEGATE